MLKDITIGQYFPGASVLHKLDPRVKIVLTIADIVMLFAASNAAGLAVGVLFLIVVYAVSKIPPSMILKSLKPVVPIIIFTSVLNMLFIDGRVLVSFWILKITAEGIQTAVFMSVRIICLIAGTSLLTYTTSQAPENAGARTGDDDDNRVAVYPDADRGDRQDHVGAEGARRRSGERRVDAARARADSDFNSAVCFGVSPCGRVGARDGVPLLSWRRGTYTHEAA